VLARLIAEGKIRHVGVSNFDVEKMDAFSVTFPVETLQPPYDLFHRDIEAEVLPYTDAHDIGVLVCGPLGHGLLSGSLGTNTRFARDDWRSRSPMFQGEAYVRNLRVVAGLGALATELGLTLPQLAISWTLTNSSVQVAIVGTRDRDHVDEALAVSATALDDAVMQRTDDLMVDAVPVAGPSPEAI
jgi:aryl-alcohol dehydrogenase-like predicted oxidoreductase